MSNIDRGSHRFVCNLGAGHDGLCVGATMEDEISAIFEPDEEAPDFNKYVARFLAGKLIHHIMSDAIDCDK